MSDLMCNGEPIEAIRERLRFWRRKRNELISELEQARGFVAQLEADLVGSESRATSIENES